MFSLGALTAVVGTAGGAIFTAGKLLSVATRDRSDLHAVVALATPSTLPVQTVRAAGEMVRPLQLPVTVVAKSRPAERSFETPKLNPLGALALVVPDNVDMSDEIFAEPVITGSLGKTPFKLAALDPGPQGDRPEKPPQRGDDHAMPLPRPRPQLASLGPVQDLGIKVEDDTPKAKTAIYDITAQAVYLPNGEKLEAHSGLGEYMDDPRFVHKKMRGATPPTLYKLSLREALFHGVQAIRLTPLNEKDMFNRDGILAHTYMLGPSGASNGCVSFRDYQRFLNAFRRGEIDHIQVVARLATPPAFYARGNTRGGTASAVSSAAPDRPRDRARRDRQDQSIN